MDVPGEVDSLEKLTQWMKENKTMLKDLVATYLGKLVSNRVFFTGSIKAHREHSISTARARTNHCTPQVQVTCYAGIYRCISQN